MVARISWLDTSPQEQRAARELISLFAQQESRDELGIGQIRDAFSDLLFPGTSVLLTRARYYLFVPWCYRTPAALRVTGEEHRAVGERNERDLIATLQAADLGEGAGLIGARMGRAVKTLPSTIYWASMLRFGVRALDGDIGALRPATDRDGATENASRELTEWAPTVPPVPDGFPSEIDGGFTLTHEEATWLRERILTSPDSAGTVLAHLLEQRTILPAEAVAVWDVVDEGNFVELGHARRFSEIMEGAPLLYNLMVGEKYVTDGLTRVQEPVEPYREALADWYEAVMSTKDDYLAWSREEMWNLVTAKNPRISRETRAFVDAWIDGVLNSTGEISDAAGLRKLVDRRERRKGKQSRLLNPKMRQTWAGWAGTGALTYRWGNVRRIVNDITEGASDARA